MLLSLSTLLMLGGCSMAPKLDMQTPSLPQSARAQAPALSATWWKAYNDPKLESLIDEALQQSDDLKLAVANVSLARASLGLSSAERYPSVNAAASAYRQRMSEEGLSYPGFIYNSFGLSATIGYEFDFWGKFKNSEDAAWSELLASEADKETLRISLISGVTELYIAQVALMQKIELTAKTVDAYRDSYEYRKREQRHGTVDPLTVEQARAQYANAQVMLASLKEARGLNANALGALLGRDPKAIFETPVEAPLRLPSALEIPEGVSSRLLERRPDIRAAEERLRASNALIGVARADYFPSISLTGSLGLQSVELDNLLKSSARTWGFGPALNVPLLDFGRVRSGVERAEAQKEAAQIQYAKSVKNAFKEVQDALQRIAHAGAQIEAQQQEVEALERVLELAQKRYASGYADYLNVLDAKRGLLAARIAMIDLDANLLNAQTLLYKALGGGWKMPESSQS